MLPLLSDFNPDDTIAARRIYRRRLIPISLGSAALLFAAWWVTQVVQTHSSHDAATVSLAAVAAAIAVILGVSLVVLGLRQARRIAHDVRDNRVAVEACRFVCAGRVASIWQSPTRRLTCEVSLVPWHPNRGEAALVRYLPRSGVILSVARPTQTGVRSRRLAVVGVRLLGIALVAWTVSRRRGHDGAASRES